MRDTITGRKSFNFGTMFNMKPENDDLDSYCNSVTLSGRMCGNRIHEIETGKCFMHRTSRCNSKTLSGKRCRNPSYANNKCHTHQPKTLFQEMDNLLIDHQQELDKMEKIAKRAKKSRRVTFDLSENVTHEVSRYIEDFEKHPNGKYVYEIDTQRRYKGRPSWF